MWGNSPTQTLAQARVSFHLPGPQTSLGTGAWPPDSPEVHGVGGRGRQALSVKCAC